MISYDLPWKDGILLPHVDLTWMPRLTSGYRIAPNGRGHISTIFISIVIFSSRIGYVAGVHQGAGNEFIVSDEIGSEIFLPESNTFQLIIRVTLEE